MPTMRRLVADEAIYHIIQRGNNRQNIFREDEDFKKFLTLMKECMNKYTSELYHYCLMSNHLHFLIRIYSREEVAKFMQALSQSYRFYYGKKYRYTGYLYQGRFKSKLITNDEYLLECGRYIERNPIRAGIVKDPGSYQWSSYNYYADSYKSDIIKKNPLYAGLGNSLEKRQLAYREYVLTTRFYEKIIDKEFCIK